MPTFNAYDAVKIELRIARESNRNTSLELKDLIEQYNEEKERIEALEEERRWRKFSDEPPEHHQWIEACYCEDRIKERLPRIEIRRWDNGMKYDVFEQELYIGWRPIPKAPKTEDIGKRR